MALTQRFADGLAARGPTCENDGASRVRGGRLRA